MLKKFGGNKINLLGGATKNSEADLAKNPYSDQNIRHPVGHS